MVPAAVVEIVPAFVVDMVPPLENAFPDMLIVKNIARRANLIFMVILLVVEIRQGLGRFKSSVLGIQRLWADRFKFLFAVTNSMAMPFLSELRIMLLNSLTTQ